MASAQKAFDAYLQYLVEEEQRAMIYADKHRSNPEGAAAKFTNKILETIRSELERVKISGISTGMKLPKTGKQRLEEEARVKTAIASIMSPTPPKGSHMQSYDVLE